MIARIENTRAAARTGGLALITAAVGFLMVFFWLAARFDYPDVLDRSAADVLPQLLALGATGRALWAVYACIPLLLIPAAIGTRALLRDAAPNALQAAGLLAAIAAVTMMVGLARWPTIQWELALSYASASPEGRLLLDGIFSGLNVYLGNFLGEFIGEIAMNGYFMLTGFAALRAADWPRWFGIAGMVTGTAGLVGAFRNVTGVVQPVADVNNYLLMVWLVVMGIMIFRAR